VEGGCGTGSQSAVMAEQGASVLGIDISAASLDAARQRCDVLGVSGAEFVQRDAGGVTDVVRDRGPFEAALLFAVLEHQRPVERLATLRACWEALVPGGHLIVGDTPNRLTWTDRHTSLLPFFLSLPEDVAREYAAFSPRESLRADMSHAPDQASANLLLARWGLGVSFHEFEASLGDLSHLVVADGFDPPLCQVMPITLEERLLFTYWLAQGVTTPVGFVRENLFVILRKPGGERPSPLPRGLPTHLRPLPLEQVGVRGALMSWARRKGVRLRQALGMAVPLSERGK
ncbi:MAG: class I SAM-dependent methyltransferase, partial [Phycisphaerales bacterium]